MEPWLCWSYGLQCLQVEFYEDIETPQAPWTTKWGDGRDGWDGRASLLTISHQAPNAMMSPDKEILGELCVLSPDLLVKQKVQLGKLTQQKTLS